MTRAQLTAFRDASARERAHHYDHVKQGCDAPVCYCDTCRADRETLAELAPTVLAWVDGVNPIRGASADDTAGLT